MAINTISVLNLQSYLENKETILIDVREDYENKAGRIPGSKLIPLAQIDIDKLPDLTRKKLVIHCKSGKRSFAACQKLIQQNPDLEIYNLEGGIDAWRNLGLPVLIGEDEKSPHCNSSKCAISLERQVQIIVGSLVFVGTLLGLIIAKIFFILPLFFGAGLIFAGIKGCCGLKIILSKLPFNQKNQNS